jgi:uncharacterized protein (TIGR02001 family)
MRKTLIALSVGAALATPLIASADEPALSANVSIASEYIYRGIAQTKGDPAIQGGFDYALSNGLYVGTWGSNLSWISDAGVYPGETYTASSSMEWDIYGGYKGSISKDLGYDVGILTYNYPGKHFGTFDPNTVEIYGALSYKWLTAKYSVTTGSLFGWTKPDGSKTTGSGYLDLTGTYDMGGGLSLSAHVGHQSVSGLSAASYTDYSIGVSKDIAKMGTIGLKLTGTDAKDSCSAGEAYCFAGYEAGKSAAILSFSKSF